MENEKQIKDYEKLVEIVDKRIKIDSGLKMYDEEAKQETEKYLKTLDPEYIKKNDEERKNKKEQKKAKKNSIKKKIITVIKATVIIAVTTEAIIGTAHLIENINDKYEGKSDNIETCSDVFDYDKFNEIIREYNDPYTNEYRKTALAHLLIEEYNYDPEEITQESSIRR